MIHRATQLPRQAKFFVLIAVNQCDPNLPLTIVGGLKIQPSTRAIPSFPALTAKNAFQ
jgi:hypothetical protein